MKFKKANFWQVVKFKIIWIVRILNYPFKEIRRINVGGKR